MLYKIRLDLKKSITTLRKFLKGFITKKYIKLPLTQFLQDQINLTRSRVSFKRRKKMAARVL